MTLDRELDLAITRWLTPAEPLQAPSSAVRSALDEIAHSPQRRPLTGFLGPQRRLVLLAAAVLITLAGVAVAAGALDRLLEPIPSPTVSPSPSAAPPLATPVAVAGGSHLQYNDEGIDVTVPDGWQTLGGNDTLGLIHLADASQRTTLAIYHGAPGLLAVCDPGCTEIDLPDYLPYVPAQARDAARRAVGEHAGSEAWLDATALNARIENAQRLDLVVGGQQPVRRVYVVGSYLTKLLVIAATAPADADAAQLLEAVLASVTPFPGQMPSVGTPSRHAYPALGFELLVPDIWLADDQAGEPGVRAFGGRTVKVSVPDRDGVLTVCDLGCRVIVAGDLAALEAATFASDEGSVDVGSITLSHAPGRYQVDRSPNAPSYRAIAIVDGTPVHLWVDLSDPNVALSVAEDIAASFSFQRPAWANRTGTTLHGEGFELVLPPFWRGAEHEPWVTVFESGNARNISVTTGDAAGGIWVCRWSEFSSADIPCAISQATTTEELARAIHIGTYDEITLDGERALVAFAESYEYPARGGQYLAFVVAVHDGRPYVIRLLNRTDGTFHLDEVLAGFRFTD